MPETAVHLLHRAEGLTAERGDAICYVCGEPCPPAPIELPPAFMNLDRFEGRGDSMCAACRHYFAAGRKYILMGSVLVTSRELRKVERADIDAMLHADPWPDEPYAITVSAAKQKQTIPWAPVTRPGSDPVISTDQWGLVRWNRAALAPVREAYRWLYLDGQFSRDSILADRYGGWLGVWAKKGGDVAQWQRCRAVLAPWLGSAELEVIAFSTPRDARKD